MRYWIFQCNPNAIKEHNIGDIEAAIKNKHSFFAGWGVRQHEKDIKEGDKAIIWLTGKEARCVALADITSNPTLPTGILKDISQFDENDTTGKRLKNHSYKVVSISTTSLPKPISKDKIRNTKGLEEFRGSRVGYCYGTNLKLEEKEYDIILRLINGN